MKQNYQKNQTMQRLILVSLFGAISALLMVLEFTIPFIPPFIKMDFSDVPVLLGGYFMGISYGMYIAVIKISLHLVLNGSATLGIGEFVNLLGSLSFLITTVYSYHRLKSSQNLWVSLGIGTLGATGTLVCANYFVMFPVYAALMNFSLERMIQLTHATNPFVHHLWSFMLLVILPFNLLKFGLTSIVVASLYSKIARVFLKR